MEQPQPAARALDALETTIKELLLSTGGIFDNPTRYESWRLPQTNSRIRSLMPKALSSFHDSLDQLEIEIRKAQAIIRRDFEPARADIVAPAFSADLGLQAPVNGALDLEMKDAADVPDFLNNSNSASHQLQPNPSKSELPNNPQGGQDGFSEVQALFNQLEKKQLEQQADKEKQARNNNSTDNSNQLPDSKPPASTATPANANTTGKSQNSSAETNKPDPIKSSSKDPTDTPIPSIEQPQPTDTQAPADIPGPSLDDNFLLPGLEAYANDGKDGGLDGLDAFADASFMSSSGYGQGPDPSGDGFTSSDFQMNDNGNIDDLFHFGEFGDGGQGDQNNTTDIFGADFFNIDGI